MPHGQIHHYQGGTFDEYGDELMGFYYELLTDLNSPLCPLMGPYGSASEAETACQREFARGRY